MIENFKNHIGWYFNARQVEFTKRRGHPVNFNNRILLLLSSAHILNASIVVELHLLATSIPLQRCLATFSGILNGGSLNRGFGSFHRCAKL